MTIPKTAALPITVNRAAAETFWNACLLPLTHAVREHHNRGGVPDGDPAYERLLGSIDLGLRAVAGLPVTDGVPHDVARLAVAARVAAFGDHILDPEVRRELDQASEAFASRIPWDDDPNNEAEMPAEEVPAP